jgi:hypothetical protein
MVQNVWKFQFFIFILFIQYHSHELLSLMEHHNTEQNIVLCYTDIYVFIIVYYPHFFKNKIERDFIIFGNIYI